MSNQPPASSSCEVAAKRVKELASEKSDFISLGKSSIDSFIQSHKYILLKLLRLPSALQQFPSFERYGDGKRKNAKESLAKACPMTGSKEEGEWGEEALHTHECCTNQKNPFLQLEALFPKDNELSPDRVKRWRLKEHQLASKKLKNLKKEQEQTYSASSKKHNIKLISDEKPKVQKVDTKQHNIWQDLLHSKEERQFQIGRITKYLID